MTNVTISLRSSNLKSCLDVSLAPGKKLKHGQSLVLCHVASLFLVIPAIACLFLSIFAVL